MTRTKLYFLLLHCSLLLKASCAQRFPSFALVEDPFCAGALIYPDLILSDISCENKWAGRIAKIGVEDLEKPETILDIVAVEKEIQGIPGLPKESLVVKLERKANSQVATFAPVDPGEGTVITKAGFKSVTGANKTTTISMQDLTVMSLVDCRTVVAPVYNIDAWYVVTDDMLCADVEIDQCVDDLGSVVFDAEGNVVGFGQQDISVCRDKNNAPDQRLPTVYRSVANYIVELEKAICRYSDDPPVSCPPPTAPPTPSPTSRPSERPSGSPSMAPTPAPDPSFFEWTYDVLSGIVGGTVGFFVGIVDGTVDIVTGLYDFFVSMFTGGDEATNAPTLSPTEVPVQDRPFWQDPPLCFSDRTTVEVQGKGIKTMDQLKIGDSVRTAGNKYDTVFSFGHYDSTHETEFLQIRTNSSQEPFEISRAHMLYVYVKKKIVLVPAGRLKVGSALVAAKTPAEITSLRTVTRRGAYAPFTATGDIVVNGFLASNYIAFPSTLQDRNVSFKMQHQIKHAAYAPYRVYCAIAGCQSESYDETTGLSPAVMMWMPFLRFFELCPSAVATTLLYTVALPGQWLVFHWIHVVTGIAGCYVLLRKTMHRDNGVAGRSQGSLKP